MQIGPYQFKSNDIGSKLFRQGALIFFVTLWVGAILGEYLPKLGLKWTDTPITVTVWILCIFGLIMAILGFLSMFEEKRGR